MSDAPEHAHIQPSDRPIIGAHGKPSRAARRAANRAKRDAVNLAEQALADIPAAFRKSSGPQHYPGTGLTSAKERRDQQTQALGSLVGQGVLSVGRPSEFTEAEADTICAWVAEGGSLRGYCRQSGRSTVTVYGWMRENAGFHVRYRQAHEDRADSLSDEIIDIVDEAALNPSIEGVAAAKLRYEARKWIASKLKPSTWGDKQVVEHKGAVSINIGIPKKPSPTVIEMVQEVKQLPGK